MKSRLHKLVFCLLITVCSLGPGGQALALSSSEASSIYNDTVWYDPNSSGSSATQCSTNLTGSDATEKIWNYLISKGLSPNATAGLMGNFKAESNFDPTATNPDSGAYGLAQWLGSRLTSLDSFAATTGLPKSDLGVQLDFMWQELSGSYKATVTDSINAPNVSVQAATQTVYDNYEGLKGSGQGSVDQRIQFANDLLAQYGSSGSGASTGDTSCTSGGPVGVQTDCTANGIVYKPEYSQAQLVKIFGPPVRDDKSSIVTVDFFGSSIPVNKLVAPCLKAVEKDLTAQGVSYRPTPEKGGIGCVRETDGQVGDRSYHVYGAACDINALTNNYFSDGKDRPYNANCPIVSSAIDTGTCYDMAPEYVKTFERYGFYWGGSFNSIKDYMHFEWHGATP